MTSKEVLEILKDSYHTPRDIELLNILSNDITVLEQFKTMFKPIKLGDGYQFKYALLNNVTGEITKLTRAKYIMFKKLFRGEEANGKI